MEDRLISAIRGKNTAEAKDLVANGADVNARDENGWTPLHHAASSGEMEIAAVLIAKGADVNAKDKYGLMPLHAAIVRGQKHVVAALVAKGASITLPKATNAAGGTTAEPRGDN